SLCRYSSISRVTPTSLAVVPSCSGLNFRLILRDRSYPETRLTSGSGGTLHFPPGCGTICLCLSAEEEKGDSCYTAICWLLWCSWDCGMERTGHLSLGAHTMVFYWSATAFSTGQQ